jgi:hypothetical protein
MVGEHKEFIEVYDAPSGYYMLHPGEKYPVHPGDIIRMGSLTFAVERFAT